ncbi:MAG: hypothetical protein ACREJD_03080 [Phycisphaerales bacterium]
MRQQQDNEAPGMFSMQSHRNTIQWVALIALAGSVSLEVFLRKGFGSRYLHMQAALAMLLILFWPLLFQHDDPLPMVWFLGAYLLMLARARAARLTTKLGRSEDLVHSRYNGTPRLCRWMPRTSENAVKSFVEPALAVGLGIVLAGLNQSLGCYLVFAGLCMKVNHSFMEAREKVRTLDMRDMLIEQQLAVERFRGYGRR